jgi:uncharacterized lipoprotein YmbA
MKRLLLVLLLPLLSGCAHGMAGFHVWVVEHNATIASVALVAGAASQVEAVAINTIELKNKIFGSP